MLSRAFRKQTRFQLEFLSQYQLKCTLRHYSWSNGCCSRLLGQGDMRVCYPSCCSGLATIGCYVAVCGWWWSSYMWVEVLQEGKVNQLLTLRWIMKVVLTVSTVSTVWCWCGLTYGWDEEMNSWWSRAVESDVISVSLEQAINLIGVS